MLDTILLVVIVFEGLATLWVEWNTHQMYKEYFNERKKWREAQRKSRKKSQGDSNAGAGTTVPGATNG